MVFIDSIKQSIQQWTKCKPANCNFDNFYWVTNQHNINFNPQSTLQWQENISFLQGMGKLFSNGLQDKSHNKFSCRQTAQIKYRC
jgi:hypothetical protein